MEYGGGGKERTVQWYDGKCQGIIGKRMEITTKYEKRKRPYRTTRFTMA